MIPCRTFAAVLGLGLLFQGVSRAQDAPSAAESPAPNLAERLEERNRLWDEARKLRSGGKLAVALATGRKMLAIERVVLPADSEELLVSINWLADVAEQGEDWVAAESLRGEALAWCAKNRGVSHWKAVDASLALENVRKLKLLPSAERKHLERAAALNGEAIRLYGEGDYAAAIAKVIEVRDIRKQILGENHPSYATSLNNLASLYKKIGNYEGAASLFLQTVEIDKRTLGENHPDYATSLNNLAGLYDSIGDYARAEPLYLQSSVVFKRTLGENHPSFATSLNDLGGLYASIGDYAKAEKLYVQASEIFKRALGEYHPSYAKSLCNLALLLMSLADFERAESLFLQASEIFKRTLGENHSDYALSLNNLAGLYDSIGDYARAEKLYLQTIEIKKRILGENHPSYATSLNNLASLYKKIGNYEGAASLFLQTVEIDKRTLGENHPDYAVSLNNLAGLYLLSSDWAKAETLYLQAIEIKKRALGENHPSYATNLNNLAFLYTAMGRVADAEPLYRHGLAISRRSLDATAAIQSERQQLAMGQGLRYQLDGYLSLGSNTGEFAREIFTEVLFWKGATLVRQRGMRLAVNEPSVQDLFGQLQRTATQLASLSRTIPATEVQQQAWRAGLDELTRDKERLEAQLSSKSAAFREATKQISLEDLLDALPQDAMLVDYLEFDRSTPPKAKGSSTAWTRELVAFVVRHADKPEDQVAMISLGSVGPITTAIDRWRKAFGAGEDAAAAGLELRRAIWEPLLPSFGDADTVLVSTDGVLGRVPLGALPGRKPDTYLLEDHRLAMIPVPQLLPALVGGEGAPELSRELLLLGDVDYDAAPGVTTTEVSKKKQPRRPGNA